MPIKPPILIVLQAIDLNYPRSTRVRNLVEYLKNYYDIHILSFGSHTTLSIESDIKIHRINYSKFGHKTLFKEFTNYKPKPGLSRFLNRAISFSLSYLLFPDRLIFEKIKIKREIKQLHQQYNYKIVIGVVMPWSFYSAMSKLKINAKLIFDIGDPLANNVVKVGGKFLNWRRDRYETKHLAKADGIVVTNNKTVNYYKQKLPDVNNIVEIPNGYNKIIEEYQNKETSTHLSEIKMIYAGQAYGKSRNIDNLVQVVSAANNSLIQLQICGVTVQNNNFNNVLFFSRLPQSDLFLKYEDANLLVFIDNAEGIQTSSKIFELAALRKPILFLYESESSETYIQFLKYSHIICCKNDFNEITSTIKNLFNKNIEIDKRLEYKKYSFENRADEYNSFLKTLIIPLNYLNK